MGKYAWKNQSLGVKIFFIVGMSFNTIIFGKMFIEDYLEDKEIEEQLALKRAEFEREEAEWLEMQESKNAEDSVVATEEPQKTNAEIFEENVRNGHPFVVSGTGGEDFNWNIKWGMTRRDANRYVHVPISGRYKITCIAIVPREWETEDDELKADYKVQVSSSGAVRKNRTANYGGTNIGWNTLSIGESAEITIDKLDYLHMTDGDSFELTLLEAQE